MTETKLKSFEVWQIIFAFDPNKLWKKCAMNELFFDWEVKEIRYDQVKTARWLFKKVYSTTGWDIPADFVIFNTQDERDEEMRQALTISQEFYKQQTDQAKEEFDKVIKDIDANTAGIEKQLSKVS